MNTIGVLLLAAATSTGGLWGKPHVGGKKLLRHHVVADGPAPPEGMIQPPVGPGGAAAGAAGGPDGGAAGRRFPNVRSQIFFVEPAGMKIGWQTAAGNGAERVYLPAQLTAPARYNFTQGYIYRLKLTDIPGQPVNFVLYPTIEVAPSTPATDAYLTHNPIPAIFTEEDFDQVKAGNFVTKVIYLPDPKYQELAVSGVETLVSTRLEPGVNPILEADRRGTILMIIRVGAIDLEMPAAGASAVTTIPGTATIPGGIITAPGAPSTAPVYTPPAGPVTAPEAPTSVPSPFTPQPGQVTPAVPVDPDAPAAPAPGAPPAPAPAPAPMPEPGEPAAPADKPADAPADKPADAPAAPADKPADSPADPGVNPTGAPADPSDAPPKG